MKRTAVLARDDKGNEILYKELNLIAQKLKNRMSVRSLVFSLCSNTIGSLVGYLSFIDSKAVPLMLSSDLDDKLLQKLLTIYNPNYLWIPKEMAEKFKRRVLFESYDYVLIEYSKESIILNPNLALLLTTSGSTGSPKLVRQSYTNIVENAKAIAKYLEIDETERAITMLPMNYTYGLSVINSHFLVGATILLTDSSYIQKPFWDFFKAEGATSIVGVPYTYEILKKLHFFNMDLPSLRYMTQAGGKLNKELHKEFAQYAKDTGRKFYVMYGQTEATARMSYLPSERSLEKCGSIGIAIPGGEFYLLNDKREKISEPGVTGELIYKGKNVMLGYATCQSDLSKWDERKGVLVTGDMAQVDEDGYYYIVGRKSRFLKIFGNRVNMDECEQMLQFEYGEDMEFACVGEDDLMFIYVTKENQEEMLKKFLMDKTGLHEKAFEVKFVEAIPKNDAGKKIYSQLE